MASPPDEISNADTFTKDARAFAIGTYADVFRGEWLPPGGEKKIPVAIKALRFTGLNLNMPGVGYQENVERINKRLGREVHVWKALQDARITPLLGFMRTANPIFPGDRPILVSPYRKNGNMATYLRENPEKDVFPLLQQAAHGLRYLHSHIPPIAHLDVKMENILIDDQGEAEICDFGLARMLDDVVTGFTTSSGSAGTLPFTSREILNGEKGSTASDVYAFAGLVLQVLSGHPPFYGCSKAKTTLQIAMGKTADRKDHDIALAGPALEVLWGLLNMCWDGAPERRPSIEQVIAELEKIQEIAGASRATQ